MYQNLRNEGVHILPVKPYLGPHQYLCSPQDSNPVKIKHDSISRNLRISAIFARLALCVLLLLSVGSALAQQPQTIDQIRVIGNRRIPKETILARLFTHQGDTYDPQSIERDFNSLWNTG
jgi:outer membrane protein insertion porin family